MKIEKIKTGESLSLTQYLKVKSVNSNSIIVTTRDGKELEIIGKKLVESCFSASQFDKQEKVGKHEIAEHLKNAGDKVFTVSYEKQDGTNRVLTGYLISAEPNLGRTKVIDLDIDPKDKTKGIRLVDNRSINYLVLDNVKYISK